MPQSYSCTYIPESITLFNCQCNIFWPYVAIIIAAAIKKDYSYRNNCGIRLHAGDIEHNLTKERKNRSSYVFLLVFMFCYSRFRFRNLEDANSRMFSWCITTRSLLICSFNLLIWLSASLYSKCTVFTVNFCYLQVLAMYMKVLS